MNVVRAWKDETYRQSLSTEELVALPTNPVGEIELTDAELETIYGASGRREKLINKIDWEEDYKPIATFGDAIPSTDSTVWCSVDSNADFEAEIEREFGKFW